MDGSDPVEIKNLTVKVKAMVRYTGALGMAEFAQATEAQVKVWLAAAGGKIKAELKQQEGVNAGFMKVEPQLTTQSDALKPMATEPPVTGQPHVCGGRRLL